MTCGASAVRTATIFAAVMLVASTLSLLYTTHDVRAVLVSASIVPLETDIVYEKNLTLTGTCSSSGLVEIDITGPTRVIIDLNIESKQGWTTSLDPSHLEWFANDDTPQHFTWAVHVPPQTNETMHDTITIGGSVRTASITYMQLDDALVSVEVVGRTLMEENEMGEDAVQGDRTMMHGLPGYLALTAVIISVTVVLVWFIWARLRGKGDPKKVPR